MFPSEAGRWMNPQKSHVKSEQQWTVHVYSASLIKLLYVRQKKRTMHFISVFDMPMFSHLPFHSPLVPVLYHTSTPIILRLSPPTTRYPVWEQSASLPLPGHELMPTPLWRCCIHSRHIHASIHIAGYFTHCRNRSLGVLLIACAASSMHVSGVM